MTNHYWDRVTAPHADRDRSEPTEAIARFPDGSTDFRAALTSSCPCYDCRSTRDTEPTEDES